MFRLLNILEKILKMYRTNKTKTFKLPCIVQYFQLQHSNLNIFMMIFILFEYTTPPHFNSLDDVIQSCFEKFELSFKTKNKQTSHSSL